MGIRDAIIMTLLLSQSLCQSRRGLAASLIQNLLSSNPQLLNMVSNRLVSAPCSGQIGIQKVQQIQNDQCCPQYQVQKIKEVPVVTKETQTIQQTQYPAQYAAVQQTEPTFPVCPSKPCPFSCPVPMVNPFLPAASPVSALCPPTSSLLPPANPSLVRSQFLRKIPIPPPCL